MARTLQDVLSTDDVAVYEFDDYFIYVTDETIEEGTYHIAICKEYLPPHHTEDHATLEEVEAALDGTLGYSRGDAAWEVCEPEQ